MDSQNRLGGGQRDGQRDGQPDRLGDEHLDRLGDGQQEPIPQWI